MASEASVRELLARGDLEGAATALLRLYGPEVMGLLLAIHRDESEAADAFASFSLDLWRGLPGFEGHASFRTWVYVLARHASARQGREAGRRARHERAADSAAFAQVAAEIRSGTATFLRTPARDAVRRLRETLTPDEQMLLVLRVDRDIAWIDIARILEPPEDIADDAALRRASTRMRQRFQVIKEKLRTRRARKR